MTMQVFLDNPMVKNCQKDVFSVNFQLIENFQAILTKCQTLKMYNFCFSLSIHLKFLPDIPHHKIFSGVYFGGA